MTKQMEEYLAVMQKCTEQCEVMVEFEQEKRQALLETNTKHLEALLPNQQAAIMMLETLEKKRLIAQCAAGYPEGATAEEILSSMEDGPEKQTLAPLVEHLRRTADGLRDLNRTALEITRNNLQIFSRLAPAPVGEKSPTYKPGRPKNSGWSGGSAFQQKI